MWQMESDCRYADKAIWVGVGQRGREACVSTCPCKPVSIPGRLFSPLHGSAVLNAAAKEKNKVREREVFTKKDVEQQDKT
ncbi:hypothetical protein EYF80_020489 [Liparis tanakae]|uniref:Uncharacterized protein n=1 Tax=Liparis tanakae TaxID=230148 RepID=A0A4Z2HUI2_9TELE|nr:hypothetical protein EYF80_020489 [Liparis tanakae]